MFYLQDWVVSRYLELGLDSSKATLGIPFYGRVYKLSDPANTQLGAESNGAGNAGPVSKTPGIMFYYEVRKLCFIMR